MAIGYGPIVYVTLQPYNIPQGYIQIPRDSWYLFPDSSTTISVETDRGLYHMGFYVNNSHHGISRNLRPWLKAHSELNTGDMLRIKLITPNQKYCLEILD